ncbi:MAG: glycosyltransferase [Desulfovibrionaceae bacterium]|nr:glycosyltransferase [Desulfovibrionaceae bacterium]
MIQINRKIRNLEQALGFNPAWACGSAALAPQLHMLGKILGGNLPPGGRDSLLLMALSLARWTWQHYPLDRDALRLLCTLNDAGAEFGAMGRLVKEIFSVMSSFGAKAPANFETPDALNRFMGDLPDFPGKDALTKRLLAEQALVHEPADAAGAVEELDAELFGLWQATARLELARKRGEDVDFTLLKPVWDEFHWHTNFCLALHDLLYPAKAGRMGPDVSLPPILLYSWNKCDALAQTLSSLRDSGIEGAPVFVLDNGSTDNSLEMIRGFERNWPGSFSLIHLPSNVGAPAARNWLLSLPDVKREPWAVFLDDDVILQPGWLDGLCKTALANPGYGAVGCRITDHIPPFGIQAADFHLLAPEEAVHSFEDLEEQIFPFCSGMGECGEAMYSYTRPCVSVTGCCHLLNMRAIEAAGAFDVRFNPSQFDDLERDLRSSLAGFPSYYHGQVCVRHMQHSSLRQAMRIPQQAHIMGNKIKLEFLLDSRKLGRLREDSFNRIRVDLFRKCARTEQAMVNI